MQTQQNLTVFDRLNLVLYLFFVVLFFLFNSIGKQYATENWEEGFTKAVAKKKLNTNFLFVANKVKPSWNSFTA